MLRPPYLLQNLRACGYLRCPLPQQEAYARHVPQLSELIQLVNGNMSTRDRKRLITLCMIDVHARDVVQRLVDGRVESASAFQRQSQLRYLQHPKTKECQECVGL